MHEAVPIGVAWVTLLLLQNPFHDFAIHITVHMHDEAKPPEHMHQVLWRDGEHGTLTQREAQAQRLKFEASGSKIALKVTSSFELSNFIIKFSS